MGDKPALESENQILNLDIFSLACCFPLMLMNHGRYLQFYVLIIFGHHLIAQNSDRKLRQMCTGAVLFLLLDFIVCGRVLIHQTPRLSTEKQILR